MRTRFIENITSIDAAQWDAVTGGDYPFLQHAFLSALEQSGSVGSASGWRPHHLLVEDDAGNQLLAVLPLYVKSHSYGEYVFDWQWADAYRRNGLDYYPKLVAAIPFTPATGPRLVCRAGERNELIACVKAALGEKSVETGASGWHCLFPLEDELPLWQAADSDVRLGCQFHWRNTGYVSFEDFLATFTSRKRKEVKRERRLVAENGIRIERLTGDRITPQHWETFYRFYQLTYLKRSGHGGYLTQDFFKRLHDTMREKMLLVLAYENDVAIAGALNFFSSTTLYGRYWGALKEVPALHFETCYYQGIEFCIEHGLQVFDPGAQGEHKIARGFTPVLTYSVHSIDHPQFRQAIGEFLVRERESVKAYQQSCMSALPFRHEPPADKPSW